jgi:Arc/MetJ-type ribon-helix-helix transcriptional regulator
MSQVMVPVDSYAQTQGYPSRSAVLHKAVRLLRATELTDAYEGAWAVWTATGEAGLWDVAAGDRVDA